MTQVVVLTGVRGIPVPQHGNFASVRLGSITTHTAHSDMTAAAAHIHTAVNKHVGLCDGNVVALELSRGRRVYRTISSAKEAEIVLYSLFDRRSRIVKRV